MHCAASGSQNSLCGLCQPLVSPGSIVAALTDSEGKFGPLRLRFQAQRRKEGRFRVKSSSDCERGIQAAEESGYQQELPEVDVGWKLTEKPAHGSDLFA